MREGEPSARYVFIDGLRGLAAAWVATFHFYAGLSDHFTRHALPEPLHSLLAFGNCGVAIFFVLSGFVIAHVVGDARLTPSYVARFMARRSVRLEPAYWATIALALTSMALSNRLRPDRVLPLPGWPKVLAHLVYAQDLLGMGDILQIFWTLCVEVQLYLGLVLLLALAQEVARGARTSDASFGWLRGALMAPLIVWSLGCAALLLRAPHGTMIPWWHLFALGALACWSRRSPAAAWQLLALMAGLVVTLLLRPDRQGVLALATCLALLLAARAGGLATWLRARPLQWLGRVSYSLYLIHPVVGIPFTFYLGHRLAGASPSTWQAAGLMLLATAASLAGAALLHYSIEAPSIALSRKIRLVAP